MTTLSVCIPYYRNPLMLSRQFREWAGYPQGLKDRIEIVLVDDGSPDGRAMTVPRPEGLPTFRLYRVLEDRPWHQHGARNLAAKEAVGEWLLLTDMDHVLPAGSLAALLAVIDVADAKAVFTFSRLDAPKLRPTLNERGQLKPHVNTFALRRSTYWDVGGYDEDAVGYGTDGYFRQLLFKQYHGTHLSLIPIIRYPREVIHDASTYQDGVEPRALRNAGRRGAETRRRLDAKARRKEPPKVLDFQWERVL